MVAISIMIEGQDGLTWPRWKRLVEEVEALGFAGLFRSDHWVTKEPPNEESLELVVSLAYLADHTQRIHFGPLVAPVSFRDPVLLARQAAALDNLSDGRCILGLGAGWMEREHDLFGYDLGDIPTRFARFAEALEVISRLLRQPEAPAFQGKYYRLGEGAVLRPHSPRPTGPALLIGGAGPKRSLPLVARYADMWNASRPDRATFEERSALLDDLLRAEGRRPSDVKRTIMRNVFWGRDLQELDHVLAWRHEADYPKFHNRSLETVMAMMAGEWNLVGTSEMIVEQLATYDDAGVDEVMLRWRDFDDMDSLRAFAQGVLLHL